MPAGTPIEPPSQDSEGIPYIPDYELIRVIGRGSYGDVWIARGVTGIYRAVKVIWRSRFPDVRPYEREFKGLTEFAAVSLTESRQLALLHVGRPPSGDYFYYVMELADDVVTGREINPATYVPLTLKRLRDNRGRIPAAECITLGVELSRALAGLHDRKLVHRDIKPSNVILVGGIPKLADIGLVAAISDSQTFIGTEGFVPPEGPGAPPADVFALGKLLYEVSTGLDRNEYPRLPASLSEIPDRAQLLELNEVIVKACTPDATLRHADASSLLAELLLLQAGKSVRRLRLAERRLGRALRVAAAFAVIAGIAGTGAWVEHRRLASETSKRLEAEEKLETLARQTVYSANLARAVGGLKIGDLGLARRVLSELVPPKGLPDLRGFEWYALWNQAQGDTTRVVQNRERGKGYMDCSVDGRYIAAWIDDSRLGIWSAPDMTLVETIDDVDSLGNFSQDGRWIMGIDNRGMISRWSVTEAKAQTLHVAIAHQREAVGCAGDNRMALIDYSNFPSVESIGLCDFNTGRMVRQFSLAEPPKGTWGLFARTHPLATGLFGMALFSSEDRKLWCVQVFDLNTGERVHYLEAKEKIPALAISPDGSLVAYALSDSSQIVVERLHSRERVWAQNLGFGEVNNLSFSRDGRCLAICGPQSPIRVVLAESGMPVDALSGQAAEVTDVVWGSGDREIYGIDHAGELMSWERDGARKMHAFKGFYSSSFENQHGAVSEDGLAFAAPINRNTIAWNRIDSPRPVATNLQGYIPIGFDPDSDGLYTVTENGFIDHYRAYKNAPVTLSSSEQLGLNEDHIDDAKWSLDHTVSGFIGRSGNVYFTDKSGRKKSTFHGPGTDSVVWFALSRDGNHSIIGDRDFMVHLIHTDTALPVWSNSYTSTPIIGQFSWDGREFAVCERDGRVEIRRTADGVQIAEFQADMADLQSMVYSRDGTRIFLGGKDGRLQVIARDGLRPLVTLDFSEGGEIGGKGITDLAMGERGNTLIALRTDGGLAVWNVGATSK